MATLLWSGVHIEIGVRQAGHLWARNVMLRYGYNCLLDDLSFQLLADGIRYFPQSGHMLEDPSCQGQQIIQRTPCPLKRYPDSSVRKPSPDYHLRVDARMQDGPRALTADHASTNKNSPSSEISMACFVTCISCSSTTR